MMGGDPATLSARNGTRSSGLRTNDTFMAETRPVIR
jgi:hypothetical protein